jgi:hypothetical protein
VSGAPQLVVVAHDAGGAEIVSAWLRRNLAQWTPTLVLGGPARVIFARKLGDKLRVVDELPSLKGVSFILCGSSHPALLERQAVRAARTHGVRCAVWLDHWTNYPERFIIAGEIVLPDEVWVADEHAAALARAKLPAANVLMRGNPYLEDFRQEVRSLDRAQRSATAGSSGRSRSDAVERILYVTEPIAEPAERATGDARGWGYTEYEALAGYLRHLADRRGPPVQLRLRPHPSEPPDKYHAVVARAPASVAVQSTHGMTLAEDVAWADTVVGCDTMAMIAALAAGRRVFSALPRGARPPSLPDPRIVRLFE